MRTASHVDSDHGRLEAGVLQPPETLTPITSSPDEWMEVGEQDGKQLLQNTRQSSCFSTDGGNTYYDIDAGDDRAMRMSEAP